MRAVRGAFREWEPIAMLDRLSVLAIPVTFCALFLVALWLNPDPRGLGTHRQLGLPPCTLQAVFHVPCPTCGMTTAFSLMAHGRPVAAFVCQPAGALLFLLSGAASIACLFFSIYGRKPRNISHWLEHKALWATGLTLLTAAWIYKIIATCL